MRSALAANAGSRGKIQLRCRHGRRASWLSQRHNVVPLIWATSPCATTACRRSVSAQRANGTPRCAGSSHARALTATTTLGGKAGRPPPSRQFRQNRFLHLLTTWRGRSRRAAMTSLDRPWAASNTSFARTTSRYGDVYLPPRASSASRSSRVSSIRYGLTLGIGDGTSAAQGLRAARGIRPKICRHTYERTYLACGRDTHRWTRLTGARLVA